MDIESFLSKLERKKLIIFDFDGVLIDSAPVHENSFKKSLDSIKDYFRYDKYAGLKTEDVFQKFLSEENLIKELTAEKRKNVNEKINEIPKIPYAEELLKLLKSKNLKIALATSGSREKTEKILERFEWRKYFDLILTEESVKNAKPSSEIYELVLSQMNFDAESAIVIEDSLSGLEAAEKAGIETVLISKSKTDTKYSTRDIYSLYTIFSYLNSRPQDSVNFRETKKVVTIIPAAGLGSRLNFDGPKILYPLSGKSALIRLYQKVLPLSEKIIIATRPEFSSRIREHIQENGLKIEVSEIENSLGTADTILSTKKLVSGEKDALIIWGDQVGVKSESLQNSIQNYFHHKPAMLVPSRLKEKPYIHIEKNSEGVVTLVKRERFNDYLPEYGENDSGIFLIESGLLFSTLEEMKQNYLINKDKESQEFDFLSIMPAISEKGYKVITKNLVSEEETIGLNNEEEAKFHEKNLEKN